jgi:hypothetical protein
MARIVNTVQRTLLLTLTLRRFVNTGDADLDFSSDIHIIIAYNDQQTTVANAAAGKERCLRNGNGDGMMNY